VGSNQFQRDEQPSGRGSSAANAATRLAPFKLRKATFLTFLFMFYLANLVFGVTT
jgi:hypothetical protein